MIKLSKRWRFLILVTAIAIVMALLTAFDLEISLALVDPSSPFGRFFEAWGEFPGFFIGSFSLAALIITRERSSRAKNWSALIGTSLLLGLISLMGYLATAIYLNIEISLWTLLPVLLIASLAWSAASRVPKAQAAALRRAAWIGLLTLVAAILVVNVVKVSWGRLRLRDMTDPAAQFTAWYRVQPENSGDASKSFPSGHSADAAVTFWIVLLPSFVPALKDKKVPLVAAAAAWTLLTMISRIVMGAHFATDTLAGTLIALGILCLLMFLIKSPRENTSSQENLHGSA